MSRDKQIWFHKIVDTPIVFCETVFIFFQKHSINKFVDVFYNLICLLIFTPEFPPTISIRLNGDLVHERVCVHVQVHHDQDRERGQVRHDQDREYVQVRRVQDRAHVPVLHEQDYDEGNAEKSKEKLILTFNLLKYLILISIYISKVSFQIRTKMLFAVF